MVALLWDVTLGLILTVGVRGRGAHIVVYTDDLDGVAPRTELVAAQEDGEGLAEVGVEGIDDGVERGVCPAKPDKHVEGGGADGAGEVLGTVRLAERNHAVKDEEGQPAAHKHSHDDRERL